MTRAFRPAPPESMGCWRTPRSVPAEAGVTATGDVLRGHLLALSHGTLHAGHVLLLGGLGLAGHLHGLLHHLLLLGEEVVRRRRGRGRRRSGRRTPARNSESEQRGANADHRDAQEEGLAAGLG